MSAIREGDTVWVHTLDYDFQGAGEVVDATEDAVLVDVSGRVTAFPRSLHRFFHEPRGRE